MQVHGRTELEALARHIYQIHPETNGAESQLARNEMWRWWNGLDAKAKRESLQTGDKSVIGLASALAREPFDSFELEAPRRKSSTCIGAGYPSCPWPHRTLPPRYRRSVLFEREPMAEMQDFRIASEFQVACRELLASCTLKIDGSSYSQSTASNKEAPHLASTHSSWKRAQDMPSYILRLEIGADLEGDDILQLFDKVARRRAFSVPASHSSVHDPWWRAAWFKAYTVITPAQFIANIGECLLWRAFWTDHEQHALRRSEASTVFTPSISNPATIKGDNWPEDQRLRAKTLATALRRTLKRHFSHASDYKKMIAGLDCLISFASGVPLNEATLFATETNLELRASIHHEILQLRADAAAQRALEAFTAPVANTTTAAKPRRRKKKKTNRKKILIQPVLQQPANQESVKIREERAALCLSRWFRERQPRRHSEGDIKCLHSSTGVILLQQQWNDNVSDDEEGSWKRVSSTASSTAPQTIVHNVQHLQEKRSTTRCVSQSSASSLPLPRKPLSVQTKSTAVDKRVLTRKTATPETTSYSDALRGVKLTDRDSNRRRTEKDADNKGHFMIRDDVCYREEDAIDTIASDMVPPRVRGYSSQAGTSAPTKQNDESLTVWRLVKANLQLRRDRLRLEAEVSRLHMEVATLRGPAFSSGVASRQPEATLHQPNIVVADDSGPPVLQPLPPTRLFYVYPPPLPVVPAAPGLGIPCQQSPHSMQQHDGGSDDGRMTIRSDLGLHGGFNKPGTLEAVREGDVLLSQAQPKHSSHPLRRASSRHDSSADNSWHAGGTRLLCGADSMDDDYFYEEEDFSTQDDASVDGEELNTDNENALSQKSPVEAGGTEGAEFRTGDHEDLATTKPPSLAVDDEPIEDPLLMEDESISDDLPSPAVGIVPAPAASVIPVPVPQVVSERPSSNQHQQNRTGANSSNSHHHQHITRVPSRREVVIDEALFSSSSGLADDVRAFAEQVSRRQRSRESAWRAARERVRDVARALWPRARVEPYGSCVTRLSLADTSSDLDLVIRLPRVRLAAPAMTPGDLEGRNAVKETWPQELARRLLKEKWVQPHSVQTIASAFVPIVKLLTVPLGDTNEVVQLDVSFEASWHRGLDANRLVLKMLDETPAARPLLLVLKQHAADRGLCASYTGGLSSYALTLLVARYLHEQPRNHTDPGALLLGFLDFYGHHFNARKTGISVGRKCFFARAELGAAPRHAVTNRGSFHFDPLYVEDPLSPGNNVGRNCFRIAQIQRAWSDAFTALTEAIRRQSRPVYRGTSREQRRPSLLASIISNASVIPPHSLLLSTISNSKNDDQETVPKLPPSRFSSL